MTERMESAQSGPDQTHRHRPVIQRAPIRIRISAIRRLILICLAIYWPCVSWAQSSQASQGSSSDEFTIRLNADIVILSATVLDHHNALVSGLNINNFQIYEDGVPQQIKHFSHEDIPVTVGILVDNSGSMKPKRNDVVDAAMAFARSSNPHDQMFVVNFNDHVSLGLPAKEPFTDRRDQLQRALMGIKTVGKTALYDGIATGLDHLKLGTRDKKVLVLISDGGDNASRYHEAQVLEMAKQSSATIYTIGIFDDSDEDRNPSVLKRFAGLTGGEAFFPESSRDITSICEEIARDIRTQYTLAYVPKIREREGGYRTIEVKASAPGHGRLSVRARTGYLVPSVSSQARVR
jgi:Ca-activated chloride channel homolog